MDSSESTKIVYSRIQKLEPELASKVVGFLLFLDDDNREMIRLAYSPDNVILSITNKVKAELGLIASKQPSFHQNASLQHQPTNSYWINSQLSPPDHNFEFPNPSNGNSIPQDYHRLPNRMQLFSLHEEIDSTCNKLYHTRLPVQGSVLAEFPSKFCHYYSKGFCKHGRSCRFLHGNCSEGLNEDQLFSPWSLERLEMELTTLLRSRNGVPISISLLPLLYYDKYGKTLQAERYLTENRRLGKAGCTLTKLLARMRTSIRLVERAHGQHSIILDEDLPKYESEQTEHGGVPIAARQIYLTFPAESTFTEQQVCNHFNGYGPVEDVRLPFHQKRMFGFVTFAFPETVRMILAKGNPHFIYGARVLVKPYRDKPPLADRKKAPKIFGLQFFDGDSNTQPLFRTFNDTRHVRKELEIERRRLSEFQLVPKRNGMANGRGNGNGYSISGFKLKEAYGEEAEFQDQERFNFLFDTFRYGSTSEERAHNDHELSQGPNLPDSPFANSMARSISTVM